MEPKRLEQLVELQMECSLQIIFRMDCACGPYLMRRRETLFPHIVRVADENKEEPVQVLLSFIERFHEGHES